MKKEKSVANKIFVVVICTLLSLYALSIILTLCWGLLTSLKSPSDLEFNENWLGFPSLSKDDFNHSRLEFFKFANYGVIFKNFGLLKENRDITYYTASGKMVYHQMTGGLGRILVNTLIYTAVGSLLHSIIPAVTAYAVAKYSNVVGKLMTGAALFAMTTPIVGSQTSMVAMLRNIALYDTFWGYLLQKATYTGMYYFVFLAFYESLPDSFAEAAEIDGASQYKILWHIIIPLSMKMLSTVFVIQVVHFWNDYQTAHIYMPTHPTVAYAIWFMTTNGQVSGDVGPRVAASMMLALPLLTAFVFLKNKLMGNVTMGGLKQ